MSIDAHLAQLLPSTHVPFVPRHNNKLEKGEKTRGGICAKSGNVESNNTEPDNTTRRGRAGVGGEDTRHTMRNKYWPEIERNSVAHLVY